LTKLTSLAVTDLLAAFRSSDPTPGGGSAAALAGAIGSSLLAMVASLPKSRAANEAALREAIAAPLAVMRACAGAAGHGTVIAALGNPSASSDVQVGFELLRAALRGAKLNVEINLGSVKDTEYVARVRDEVEALESGFGGH
jgi:formiminotetrahydrofolate cyclodeaminase